MRLFDLIALVFDNLGRRKGRVALTAIGVVIGTSAVVVLVSLGIGLQENANSQLYGIGDLTQIQVSPGYNEGPVAVNGPGGGGGEPSFTPITDQSLADFAALPGVERVIPRDYFYGSGMLYYNRLETYANLSGVGVEDLADMNLQAQAGETTLEKGTAVIGAMIPMNFYDPRLRPGQEPPPPPDLVGQTVKLTIIKWDQEGQEIRKNLQLRIVGMLTETQNEPDWSIYISLADLTAMNEWVNGKRIDRNKDGYAMVIVQAADAKDVTSIAEQITNMGYMAYTPQSYVEGINSFYLVLQIMFGAMGAIALLVAAIGIANTMAMAILERTREIGLMKAVGATNMEVLSIFLGESAGIGFIGGVGGVILGWSAGQIVNVLGQVYLAGQTQQQGYPTATIAVITPLWLLGFALVFATLVGLISGIYPALRAATLVPITALKYE
ncbi:MAG TPA: ABC transporter permease [Anaerolineales bacterium]|nr:ABC transporter permease [Anaerolineales bacterium]